MSERSAKHATLAAGMAAAAVLAVGASGCELNDPGSDLVAGKQMFVQKCGACHVLSRAGTQGVTGPNLDEAFQRSLRDGLERSTVKGLVERQILYPATGESAVNPKMPAKLFTGEDAENVAAYVSYAAARAGEDTGALAEAVESEEAKEAAAKDGKLEITSDPNGQLRYLVSAATAEPGALEITSKNESAVPHNIALEGAGIDELGKVVQDGGTSRIKVTVKRGEYTFYCSVQGHRQAGMEGKLTVE